MCLQSLQYRDSVGNTIEENSGVFSLSEYASCHQQGYAGSKTLLQQNLSVLNQECWLTQVGWYNSHKMVMCVIYKDVCHGDFNAENKHCHHDAVQGRIAVRMTMEAAVTCAYIVKWDSHLPACVHVL